jgi:uncharacterized MAPEG superfamily protein
VAAQLASPQEGLSKCDRPYTRDTIFSCIGVLYVEIFLTSSEVCRHVMYAASLVHLILYMVYSVPCI